MSLRKNYLKSPSQEFDITSFLKMLLLDVERYANLMLDHAWPGFICVILVTLELLSLS